MLGIEPGASDMPQSQDVAHVSVWIVLVLSSSMVVFFNICFKMPGVSSVVLKTADEDMGVACCAALRPV